MKQNVTITMESDLWQSIRCYSARCGVSSSALISVVMSAYCEQQKVIMDRLLNATPRELAEYKKVLEEVK